MLADFKYSSLKEIESHTMNSFTGNYDYASSLLTQVKVTGDQATPKIQVESIKECSLLLKKCNHYKSDILVLESDKFLVGNLVVHRF